MPTAVENHGGLVSVNINQSHRGTDQASGIADQGAVSVNINQSHRPADQAGLVISEQQRGADQFEPLQPSQFDQLVGKSALDAIKAPLPGSEGHLPAITIGQMQGEELK